MYPGRKDLYQNQNTMKNYLFSFILIFSIFLGVKISAQEVGFSPFLAVTISNVNFRNGPSTSDDIIKKIPANSTVYIFSKTDYSGFYKSIDVESGKVGWLAKNLVKWSKDVDTSSAGGFSSLGETSEYNSELKVTNKSTKTITLVISDKTFYISPQSTITKFIEPGNKNFTASAPGVIPNSGYKTFSPNNGYEWTFWIETRRR